jgi:hypothetical protein
MFTVFGGDGDDYNITTEVTEVKKLRFGHLVA